MVQLFIKTEEIIMSKKSARIVILTGILSGLEVAKIVESAKKEALVTKEDSAIKKDINWYKSYAKKEGLVDADMKPTEAGKKWLENGGKKPSKPKAEKPQADKKPAAKTAETKAPAKKPAPKAPAKKPAATKPAETKA